MRPSLVLLAGLTPLLSSCSPDPSSRNHPAASLEGPDRPLAWTAQEVYAVGGFDAPEWATFGEVQEVAFDGEGNLYILDGQTARVTVVGPDGAPLRTFGGLGDGPGEIGTALGMAVLADGRVVISDLGKRGLAVFDRSGEWLGNVPLELSEEGIPRNPRALGAGNRVVASESLRLRMSSGAGDVDVRRVRDTSRPVWSYPAAPGDSAVLAYSAWAPPPPPAGGESSLESQTGSGGAVSIRMARTQAFEPALHVAALPDGRLAVVDSVGYRIKLVRPGVGVEGVLERPKAPTPVTPTVQELERTRRLDAIVGGNTRLQVLGGGGPAGGVALNPDAVRRMMEDQVANLAFFPEIPVVEALAADPLGRIWVQRSAARPGDEGPTDVLSADGRYLGTLPPDGLRIPDAFGPGGLAAIIKTDDLDVSTIRVVRLGPVNPGGSTPPAGARPPPSAP
ncbi:MAG: hypothetical protein RQ751_07490 [Longimicrobiales bacterium]|nr:hypothetical protein [Longimicrobiales bacterium]